MIVNSGVGAARLARMGYYAPPLGVHTLLRSARPGRTARLRGEAMHRSRPVVGSICLVVAPRRAVADRRGRGKDADCRPEHRYDVGAGRVDARSTTASWCAPGAGGRSEATKAYKRTLSKATKKGMTATTRTAGVGGSVTFEFGPRRGKAQILVGGRVRKTVSTAAREGQARARSTVSGSGKVQVRVVAAGKGVFLDKIVPRAGRRWDSTRPAHRRPADARAVAVRHRGAHPGRHDGRRRRRQRQLGQLGVGVARRAVRRVLLRRDQPRRRRPPTA